MISHQCRPRGWRYAGTTEVLKYTEDTERCALVPSVPTVVPLGAVHAGGEALTVREPARQRKATEGIALLQWLGDSAPQIVSGVQHPLAPRCILGCRPCAYTWSAVAVPGYSIRVLVSSRSNRYSPPRSGSSPQQSLRAQIFVSVWPVDAISTTTYLPICPLFWCSVKQSGVPR